MEKVGLFHFVAEPYLMDFRGRVTLPMIGNYLIHAASSHAGERGFGFNDMSERHTAWVLSRLAIEMKEYPTAFDKINLYTWIDEVGRLFTSRCLKLADDLGKTYWAAIDSPAVLFGRLSTWTVPPSREKRWKSKIPGYSTVDIGQIYRRVRPGFEKPKDHAVSKEYQSEASMGWNSCCIRRRLIPENTIWQSVTKAKRSVALPLWK